MLTRPLAPMSAPGQALNSFIGLFPEVICITYIVLFPTPNGTVLGASGEIIYVPIAGFIFLLSHCLVCLTWVVLSFCLSIYGKIANIFSRCATASCLNSCALLDASDTKAGEGNPDQPQTRSHFDVSRLSARLPGGAVASRISSVLHAALPCLCYCREAGLLPTWLTFDRL